jgi:Ca2+-binding RTX toxin-like protein
VLRGGSRAQGGSSRATVAATIVAVGLLAFVASAIAGDLAGSREGDRLAGTARGEKLSGRGGADLLLGRGGRDRLIGGKGEDALYGGKGNDRLRARDGSDDLVDCGPGRRDVAVVGPTEDGVYDCERVLAQEEESE